MCYDSDIPECSNAPIEGSTCGGCGATSALHPRCKVLHGHEAMPQALVPSSLGRSKPNSLLEGTDNDVFIPYHERCRSFSCLFAHVAPCQAPSPRSPWKDGEGSSTGGPRQGTHIGIPVGNAILNAGTSFHESPQMQRLGNTSIGFCALKSPAQCLPGWGDPWDCHLPCVRHVHDLAKVLFFI